MRLRDGSLQVASTVLCYEILPNFVLCESPREIMMGVGVASVIMLTFTKMPSPHAHFYKDAAGPHADTAWAVIG